MKRSPPIILITLLIASLFGGVAAADSPVLTQGIEAYQEQHWHEAMGYFLQVLTEDPGNPVAHTYLNLLAQELDSERRRTTHDARLALLTNASQLLDAGHMDARPVEQAIQDTTSAERARQMNEHHSLCAMARTEAELGHLPAANDLVFQVIAENPNDAEAQRLLSDLQSQIRQTLDSHKDLPVVEYQTLEGFYAYGQADYASAVLAWREARSALAAQLPPEEVSRQVAFRHFEPYEKLAQAHLDEEHETIRIRALFNDGVTAYEARAFDTALGAFRQVALADPDYPQLGQYLVQSEAAALRKRTSTLSDAKRGQTEQAFERGVASLEKEDYANAQASFEEVLAMDPAHPQAKLYLQQIETEKSHRTDPQAAQQHYEEGLIVYVEGDLEQAAREWHIALRLDPDNPKVLSALHKIQRELASTTELP